MQKRDQTVQASRERDSQANLQRQKQAEESSKIQTHEPHPLEQITSGIGDATSVAKHVALIQRTGLFHPMNQRQKVQQLLRLQQRYGNRFVQRVIAEHAIQTKLQVNQPGDAYEQEADQVAEAVMQMPESRVQRQIETAKEKETLQTKTLADQVMPLLQKQTKPAEETLQTKPLLQCQVTNQATSTISSPIAHDVLRSQGQPLAPDVRANMEARFGYDFSQVRVHADSEAAESAQTLGALAYTTGDQIVFGRSQYAPETNAGRKLIAHELVHVIQQSAPGASHTGIIQRRRSPDCSTTRPVPFHDTVSGISGTEFSDSFRHLGGTVSIRVSADYDADPGPVIEDCDEDYSVQLMQCDLVFDNAIGNREVACIGHTMSFSRTIPTPGFFGSGPEYYFRIRNGSSGTTITAEIDVT